MPQKTKVPVNHRKPRRDAKLLNLPEEKRQLIIEWAETSMAFCVERIQTELGISISRWAVRDTLTKWRVGEEFAHYLVIAREQAQREADERGLTPEEMEEAVDRNFIILAVKTEDLGLYRQMRYLRIADQKAKRQHRIAEAKLQQGEKALRQRDKALELVERRVILLEKRIEEAKAVTQNQTLSAEERAQRVREILGD